VCTLLHLCHPRTRTRSKQLRIAISTCFSRRRDGRIGAHADSEAGSSSNIIRYRRDRLVSFSRAKGCQSKFEDPAIRLSCSTNDEVNTIHLAELSRQRKGEGNGPNWSSNAQERSASCAENETSLWEG